VKLPKSDEPEPLFYCPCHAAHFTTDGKRVDQVSPRDMDALEVKVENGMVCVRYENFVVGVVDKKAMS
ncbi:MAG: hypothetical protein LBU65_09775, partial [Planctomycetaceae bacterium]|nr:hypothetical protein [Planctomycetaceae bacterium]